VKEVHAVDAAGVHPLLLAIGSERYTPYMPTKQPAEILTIANHILGTGQLSLAKFLFITADDSNQLSTHNIEAYLRFVLERMDLKRDVHFYTKTTIDTLDYSGTGLNTGSKVVFAAYGDKLRELGAEVPAVFKELKYFRNPLPAMAGIVVLQAAAFTTYEAAAVQIDALNAQLHEHVDSLQGVPLIVLCDDTAFASQTLNNFLWTTFTRCNPSHDIYGIGAFTEYKHWGCNGPLVIDARIKPHHAPPVVMDEAVNRRIDKLYAKGGSLSGIE
jgi:4-hydroxy-3-polyprenylbenzoate decarboxylase